jgi:hypothetical protein
MGISNAHNLAVDYQQAPKPFGVRVSLRPEDPFRKLVGADWSRTHWFASATERDAALLDIGAEHEYSRPGDRPALKLEKVENLSMSRGL